MFSGRDPNNGTSRRGLLFTILVVGAALSWMANFAGAGGRSRAERVTVIGMDAVGRAAGIEVPADQYRAALSAGLSAVNTSIRPALKASAPAARPASSQPSSQPAPLKTWNLRSIGVGVGLTGQIGLGPIFQLSLAPRLRLVFTNSLDPIYPD